MGVSVHTSDHIPARDIHAEEQLPKFVGDMVVFLKTLLAEKPGDVLVRVPVRWLVKKVTEARIRLGINPPDWL